MRRVASLTVVVLALAAPTAPAQTLVVSHFKCPTDKLMQVRQLVDSVQIAIAQELVNEGTLTAAAAAYHAWGRRVERRPVVHGSRHPDVSGGVR